MPTLPEPRRLAESWAQSCQLPLGPARTAMQRTIELEAQLAASVAIELAEEAVAAHRSGQTGDAMALLAGAAREAREATSMAWSFLDGGRPE